MKNTDWIVEDIVQVAALTEEKTESRRAEIKCNLKPFIIHEDNCPGPRWTIWLRSFELYLSVNDEKSDDNKRKLLLYFGGTDIQNLYENMPEAQTEENGLKYQTAVEKLNKHLCPKVLAVFERSKFKQMCQQPNERIESFIIRLRNQSNKCNFGSSLEMMIIDQIVEKGNNLRIRSRILERDFNLYELQNMANTLEAKMEEKEDEKINAISNYPTREKRIFKDSRECFNCGRQGHIAASPDCPAKNRECNKCGRKGHFGVKCS